MRVNWRGYGKEIFLLRTRAGELGGDHVVFGGYIAHGDGVA